MPVHKQKASGSWIVGATVLVLFSKSVGFYAGWVRPVPRRRVVGMSINMDQHQWEELGGWHKTVDALISIPGDKLEMQMTYMLISHVCIRLHFGSDCCWRA